MNPAELAELIRAEEHAEESARMNDDAAAAQRHRSHADTLKQQLWNHDEVHRGVQGLIDMVYGRFRGFLERSGIERSDLENQLYPRFHRSVGRFDPTRGQHLWPFLNVVFLHHLMTILQRLRRRREMESHPLPDGDKGEPADTREQEVESRVWRSEIRQRIDVICQELVAEGWPAERMKAFQLYRIQSRRQQTIAEEMGRSVGWVNNAIHTTEAEVRNRWREIILC